jgi:hypothetical protein
MSKSIFGPEARNAVLIRFGAENFDSRNRRFRFYYCSLWNVDRPLADFCNTILPKNGNPSPRTEIQLGAKRSTWLDVERPTSK